MGFGDAFKSAFSNDDSLGNVQNAGLKNGPQINSDVSVNGKMVPQAVVGQKVVAVANKVRVKIPVNCQKGDCGTCVVSVNGRKVKACQTSIGAGKTKIVT
jgi:ferredoxin